MMMKKWLSYSLVILIALQSLAAIADTHQSHQSGSIHLSFEHDDSNFELISSVKSREVKKNVKSGQQFFDCHHCCHCHGSHLSYLTTTDSSKVHSIARTLNSVYLDANQSAQPTSLYRPPRV